MPPRLTEQRRTTLLGALTAGDSLRNAAETADIGERTLMRYLARGQAAQHTINTYLDNITPLRQQVIDRLTDERLTQHLQHQIPEGERWYWQVWQDVTRARARAGSWSVAQIRRAGQGGYMVRETTTLRKDVLTREGEVVRLEESRTVEREQPMDWRAIAFLLSNGAAREDWRPVGRLELTGADAGPIQVESVDAKRERALALFDEAAAAVGSVN